MGRKNTAVLPSRIGLRKDTAIELCEQERILVEERCGIDLRKHAITAPGDTFMAHTVTTALRMLKNDEQLAATQLWNHFMTRLIAVAQVKLGGHRKDEAEEVALEAFSNLCLGVRDGRFKKLDDRHDLWQVLAMLAERRAIDRLRKAPGSREFSGSQLADADSSSPDHLAQAPSTEPSPEFVTEIAELYEILIEDLRDAPLQQVARLHLQGYKAGEIAEALDCSQRTVNRKLEKIRGRWVRLIANEEA